MTPTCAETPMLEHERVMAQPLSIHLTSSPEQTQRADLFIATCLVCGKSAAIRAPLGVMLPADGHSIEVQMARAPALTVTPVSVR